VTNLRTVLLLVMLGGAGCAAAVGAAAGATGAVVYTNRGVKSDVAGSVTQVDARARDTFADLGISTTGTSTASSGLERKLEGRLGDTDVTVEMKSVGKGVTHVEVLAKEGTIQWDKELARRVMQEIVGRG
jgi:hypothetical protein